MDIKQLKYDLSMQCALADVMYERSKLQNDPNYDIRIAMLDKFETYYEYYSSIHESRWYDLKNLD